MSNYRVKMNVKKVDRFPIKWCSKCTKRPAEVKTLCRKCYNAKYYKEQKRKEIEKNNVPLGLKSRMDNAGELFEIGGEMGILGDEMIELDFKKNKSKSEQNKILSTLIEIKTDLKQIKKILLNNNLINKRLADKE